MPPWILAEERRLYKLREVGNHWPEISRHVNHSASACSSHHKLCLASLPQRAKSGERQWDEAKMNRLKNNVADLQHYDLESITKMVGLRRYDTHICRMQLFRLGLYTDISDLPGTTQGRSIAPAPSGPEQVHRRTEHQDQTHAFVGSRSSTRPESTQRPMTAEAIVPPRGTSGAPEGGLTALSSAIISDSRNMYGARRLQDAVLAAAESSSFSYGMPQDLGAYGPLPQQVAATNFGGSWFDMPQDLGAYGPLPQQEAAENFGASWSDMAQDLGAYDPRPQQEAAVNFGGSWFDMPQANNTFGSRPQQGLRAGSTSLGTLFADPVLADPSPFTSIPVQAQAIATVNSQDIIRKSGPRPAYENFSFADKPDEYLDNNLNEDYFLEDQRPRRRRRAPAPIGTTYAQVPMSATNEYSEQEEMTFGEPATRSRRSTNENRERPSRRDQKRKARRSPKDDYQNSGGRGK